MRRKVLDPQVSAPSGDGCVGASRQARKHGSFRRLQKLDSERHGAAAAGEQLLEAAARRDSFDRKVGDLARRWRKQH